MNDISDGQLFSLIALLAVLVVITGRHLPPAWRKPVFITTMAVILAAMAFAFWRFLQWGGQ